MALIGCIACMGCGQDPTMDMEVEPLRQPLPVVVDPSPLPDSESFRREAERVKLLLSEASDDQRDSPSCVIDSEEPLLRLRWVDLSSRGDLVLADNVARLEIENLRPQPVAICVSFALSAGTTQRLGRRCVRDLAPGARELMDVDVSQLGLRTDLARFAVDLSATAEVYGGVDRQVAALQRSRPRDELHHAPPLRLSRENARLVALTHEAALERARASAIERTQKNLRLMGAPEEDLHAELAGVEEIDTTFRAEDALQE